MRLPNSRSISVPPTGSISYINNSTSSIHPVASKIEIRKEGKIGRVYYPAPYLISNHRLALLPSALFVELLLRCQLGVLNWKRVLPSRSRTGYRCF